jgi:hypothetical protein
LVGSCPAPPRRLPHHRSWLRHPRISSREQRLVRGRLRHHPSRHRLQRYPMWRKLWHLPSPRPLRRIQSRRLPFRRRSRSRRGLDQLRHPRRRWDPRSTRRTAKLPTNKRVIAMSVIGSPWSRLVSILRVRAPPHQLRRATNFNPIMSGHRGLALRHAATLPGERQSSLGHRRRAVACGT